MIINQTRDNLTDLGSFELNLEYIVIGGGKQSPTEAPKTCINVLKTTQVKFQELGGEEILFLAKELVKKDLRDSFDGPFNPYVTSVALLPQMLPDSCYKVFICAQGFTENVSIMFSKALLTYPKLDWTNNMGKLCDDVYDDLAAQMSTIVHDFDPNYFGVDFIAFNIL